MQLILRCLCLFVVFLAFPWSAASASIIVNSCTALANAIGGTATPIVIPVGTVIDVTTCSDGSLPTINRPLTIQGAGFPAPTITGRNKTNILTFGASSDGSSYNFTLSNLVISNGYIDPSAGGGGACLWAQSSSNAFGTANNVNFTNCMAAQGAAIFMDGQSGGITVNNCTFRNNTAIAGPDWDVNGGAIFSNAGSSLPVSISGCTFINNNAVASANANSAYGGAVSADGSVFIWSSTFTGNFIRSAAKSAWGGAVSSTQGVYATASSFTSNTATAVTADAGGGAINTYTGPSTVVTACTFVGNGAQSGPKATFINGGAMSLSTAYISSSSFSSNFLFPVAGDAEGGAVYVDTYIESRRSSYTNNSITVSKSGNARGAAVAVEINTNNVQPPGPAVFAQSSFSSNSIRGGNCYGGAVYSTYSANFASCSFVGNSAMSTATPPFNSIGDAIGGAYYMSTSDSNLATSFSLCTFFSNSVSGINNVGGGAWSCYSNVADTQSTYFNNSALLGSSRCNRNTQGCPSGAYGGAIWLQQNAALQEMSSTFNANSATSLPSDAGGGAIALPSSPSSAVVTNCTFLRNQASSSCTLQCQAQYGGGGAVYSSSQLTIAASSFSNNTHTSRGVNNYAAGGAVAGFSDSGGFTLISASTFTANAAASADAGQASGGAVSVNVQDTNNVATVTSSTFVANLVSGQNAGGGALSSLGGVLNVAASTFSSNAAVGGGSQAYGGAIDCHLSSNSLSVSASSFTFNSASDAAGGYASGGAVYWGGTTTSNIWLSVSASSFTSNSANSDQATGGAVCVGIVDSSGGAAFSASTFDGNSAVGQSTVGGAISLPAVGTSVFCGHSSFGQKIANGVLQAVGSSIVVNDLDAGGANDVLFCPEVPVYTDVNSRFYPKLDCSSCDCSTFNPCDPRATCTLTQSPQRPICQCPAGSRGNGFTCGPVKVCY